MQGFEVDQAARRVIDKAGHGERFVHRTGHSIGREVHGNGANMDDLETHDERLVLPRTCFSIEPGIYGSDFGIRSEVNVFIDEDGGVHVTGGLQKDRSGRFEQPGGGMSEASTRLGVGPPQPLARGGGRVGRS